MLSSVAAELAAINPLTFVLQVTLDVTDEEGVKAAISVIATQFAGLDILINNAGFYEPQSTIANSLPEIWWKSVEVNLKGPYLLARACLPYLIKSSGGGQIVNVTSTAAHRILETISAYSTSKFALLRFTELLHLENEDFGLVAMCLHPGNVPTEMGLSNPKSVHHCEQH